MISVFTTNGASLSQERNSKDRSMSLQLRSPYHNELIEEPRRIERKHERTSMSSIRHLIDVSASGSYRRPCFKSPLMGQHGQNKAHMIQVPREVRFALQQFLRK